ncbi:flagellar protein export ATPase FliI [Bacillus fonticola]|uniref:flagellar protein export ATPase FliI n=1 Tax=Bacillus fonticola TaxID=2728853 RepID=UPI00147274C7|nr:flagellar protein export ATPase FliI [Bacillus fonticola]
MKAIDLVPHIAAVDSLKRYGRIQRVVGLLLESQGPQSSIGDVCWIHPSTQGKGQPILAEVVGFQNENVMLMPYKSVQEISPGSLVEATGSALQVRVGEGLVGRVLDALGHPMDEKLLPKGLVGVPTDAAPPNPLTRPPIHEPIGVGVRAIDSLLTVGKGQRVGIFAGSGVGKSTLLGMIAKKTTADINVIALIGERGREIREFIERDLGEEGRKRTIVVAATSDQPALMRIKGAYTATSIAEYFRAKGYNVMFMMDSVTRVAMAQREVGLAVGEPPATKGYTPSVFAMLPKLLERTGTSHQGSITAFYTVLVDGDDLNEPITDAVRGILDGHIVLDRDLANQGHFPAIQILKSVSRLMPHLVSAEHVKAANRFRELYSTYKQSEDLIQIGAYKRGSSKDVDEAVQRYPDLIRYLKQETFETGSFAEHVASIQHLLREGERV